MRRLSVLFLSAVLLAGCGSGSKQTATPGSSTPGGASVAPLSTPFLLRRAAGVEKGAQNARTETVGEVTHDQVRKIAETKMPDLNAIDIDGAIAQVEGTARSMGLKVVDKASPRPTPEEEEEAAAEEATA